MELNLEWLGLVSSFLWAVAFIVAVIPVNRLGSFAFNRWRMLCSSLILGSAALCTGGYGNISAHQVILMCLSGAVGICIGDVALFACFNRLGPRLSGILFTTHAFFSVAIGLLCIFPKKRKRTVPLQQVQSRWGLRFFWEFLQVSARLPDWLSPSRWLKPGSVRLLLHRCECSAPSLFIC